MLIEWGDAILPALPNDYLEVRLRFDLGADVSDDEPRLGCAASAAAGRTARSRCSTPARPWAETPAAAATARPLGSRGRPVLILGITTSTHAGRVRHRRPRGRAGPGPLEPGQAPRRVADAVDRLPAPAGPHRPRRDRLRRRRRRPGSVHRPAGRGRRGQGHGPRPADPDGGRGEPRPAGVPRALDPRLDRRRHRRPAVRAVHRLVPAGARGHPAPTGARVASPPTTSPCDLEATGEDVLARRRRRAPLPRGVRGARPGRAGRPGPRPPVGGVAGAAGARPGAARGVRAAVGAASRSTCAGPTPRSTGRPATGRSTSARWGAAGGPAGAVPRARGGARPPDGPPAAEPVADPGSLEVRITPMRRRHLRGVIRIEQQVYPRPWTFGLFLSEIGQRTTRLYVVARVGGEVAGYAGLFRAVDDGHITTVAVDPAWQRHGIATRMLWRWRAGRRSGGASTSRWRCACPTPGRRRCTSGSASCPPACARATTRRPARTRVVMWANDIDAPAYAARLAAIERTVPGRRSSTAAGCERRGGRAGGHVARFVLRRAHVSRPVFRTDLSPQSCVGSDVRRGKLRTDFRMGGARRRLARPPGMRETGGT